MGETNLVAQETPDIAEFNMGTTALTQRSGEHSLEKNPTGAELMEKLQKNEVRSPIANEYLEPSNNTGLVQIKEEPIEESAASRKLRDICELFPEDARNSVSSQGMKASALAEVLQKSQMENSPSALIIRELLQSTNPNENTFEVLEQIK